MLREHKAEGTKGLFQIWYNISGIKSCLVSIFSSNSKTHLTQNVKLPLDFLLTDIIYTLSHSIHLYIQFWVHLKGFQRMQCMPSAVSGLFCLRTGLLPCASWGHCIWVTVPLRVRGRFSSRWGPHVTVAVVLGSSRAGPRLLKCWQLQRKIWKSKHEEWEWDRKRLPDSTQREKRERTEKEKASGV